MKINKHGYAASFALIGAGIGGLFLDGLTYLPLIYGLCGGCFAGYFFAGLIGAKSKLLQKDFQKLGDLSGKSIEEICAAVGMYQRQTACKLTDGSAGKLYTWVQDHYSITLIFDSEGKCVGVQIKLEH